MPVDIQSEFASMRAKYKANTAAVKPNFLITGDMGTGKTKLLGTAPKPIVVHSFDPGGTLSLTKEIEAGYVIPEQFEKDDARSPVVFREWTQNFNRKADSGFFNQIGTYAIDSATMWSDAMMNEWLKSQGRPGSIPQLQDYLRLMLDITNTLKIFASLPCYCILTAHIEVEKDEVTGRMKTFPMIVGKALKVKIPLLFDEVYVAEAKGTSTGTEFSLLTKPDGIYQARSRIGAGRFETHEKPDIKALLAKAGLDASDKQFVSK